MLLAMVGRVSILLLLMAVVGRSSGASSIHQVKICEPLKVPFCQDLPYNQTFVPTIQNLQMTQEDVDYELNYYSSLVNANCSAGLRLFVCSVYAPVCSALESRIPPCRSLCLSALNDCHSFMNQTNFDWPDILDCDKFPADDDGSACLSNEGVKNNFSASSNSSANEEKIKDKNVEECSSVNAERLLSAVFEKVTELHLKINKLEKQNEADRKVMDNILSVVEKLYSYLGP
ncbi:frizzled-7-like [Neocloeon triangulifer]|uniref:frizzled-7-like n=1 Tax=Neocloeon triangulifer TaxID=2078957 RepID=UPI00286F8CDE|nr:frizzled-7-like [Neocloeon triangulifer]